MTVDELRAAIADTCKRDEHEPVFTVSDVRDALRELDEECEELAERVREARRAVLEEAARVAEKWAEDKGVNEDRATTYCVWIARDIRALMEAQ